MTPEQMVLFEITMCRLKGKEKALSPYRCRGGPILNADDWWMLAMWIEHPSYQWVAQP